MSYVSQNLTQGEEVIYEARIHWSIFVLPVAFIIVGLALRPFIAVGILLLIGAVIRKTSTELVVTNRRVIAKFGLIRRRTIEQRLEKVDSIQVRQGILERLLGAGSIIISGSGLSATPIPGIEDPLHFKNKVNDAIDRRVLA